YYGRSYDEGKKITWRDGVAALYYIFRFNVFCSLRRSFKVLPSLSTESMRRLESRTEITRQTEI
ncbi:MAG TPA: hypothetical protein VGI80_09550, partial [Pyrinomonadaceae bacterium]